ncbi:MAG: hypothetical protein GC166_07855 [Alphaproteobacteria bacterium]|nr:hypothetical protein [Alphaproteobacteria bacterium]
MLRKIGTATIAAIMLVGSATAALADSAAIKNDDLAPGGAAGVQQAQGMMLGRFLTNPYVIGGIVAAAIAIPLAINNNNSHQATGTNTP